MAIMARNEEFLRMVDAGKGTVDRRIFADQDIYEMELERIFARAWLFMAHDSMIPNPGDFFLTFMGEDRVIVVRDNDGNPQVLVNSCRHRGNAVCRAEEGHATSFMCTYHGWTFDLKGALAGVPGFKEVYHEELDRENWGLIKAAQVDTYQGFIFATMDPEAPGLYDFLGEVGRMCIDFVAVKGDMKVVPGIQKSILPCNWKFAADNVWDYYHAPLSHASAFQSGWNAMRRRPASDKPAEAQQPAAPRARSVTGAGLTQKYLTVLGEYGHALSGPRIPDGGEDPLHSGEWRDRPGVAETLGIAMKSGGHPHVFPNLWSATSGDQISLRLPKGPNQTEIWWFTLVDANATTEYRDYIRDRSAHVFGPAGMLEQDDGENWGQSTRGAAGVISKQYPLNYAMSNHLGELFVEEQGPPYIESSFSEHAALWLYRAWSEWMAAESWDDLKAHHSPVPRERL